MENINNKVSEINKQAEKEGWFIVYAETPYNSYQLQRIDDENKFSNDVEAVKFVFNKSLQKSKLHIDAIEFLRENASPEELEYLVQFITKN